MILRRTNRIIKMLRRQGSERSLARTAYSGVHKVAKYAAPYVMKKGQEWAATKIQRTWKKHMSSKKSKGKGSRIHGKGLAGETNIVRLTYKAGKKSAYNVMKKIGNGSNYRLDATVGISNATLGNQQADNLLQGMSQADLTAAFNNTAKYYNVTTSSVITPGMNTTGYGSQKFLLKRFYSDTELVNQSMAVVNIDFYTCISKVTKPYVDPITDWNTGYTDQGQTLTRTFYGAKPTESKIFNINWKIVKVHRVQLMGGQTYHHIVDFKPKRMIDTEYVNKNSQIRGITINTFIVTRGQVADDSNTIAIGVNTTTTPVKVIGIQSRVYDMDVIMSYPRISGGQTNVPTSAGANLYVVNEESGLVVDEKAGANYA